MKSYSEIDIKLVNKSSNEVYNIIGVHDYSDNLLQAAFGCKDVKVDDYKINYEGTYLTGIAKLIFVCDVDLEKRKVVKRDMSCTNTDMLEQDVYDMIEESNRDYYDTSDIDSYDDTASYGDAEVIVTPHSAKD